MKHITLNRSILLLIESSLSCEYKSPLVIRDVKKNILNAKADQ